MVCSGDYATDKPRVFVNAKSHARAKPLFAGQLKPVFITFLFLRCKKHEVPVEKVYNKTQREKFAWALDMAEKDFVF